MGKIGIALSGGGVRAFAHQGVLYNLHWMGIPIHVISGSSVGAVIGAAYAAGINLDTLKNTLLELTLMRVVNPIIPYFGLSNFDKIKKLLQAIGMPRNFEDLKVPLIVAATDLKRRETVYFNNGNLWDALFASLALPGIFYPVRMGDWLLVDGGISMNLPVSILRANGADFVIASDVNTGSRTYPELTNSFRIVYESMTLMVEMNTRTERAAADFVIDTALEGTGFLDFCKRADVVNRGLKDTYGRTAELKKLLEEKQYVQDRGLGPLFISPLS